MEIHPINDKFLLARIQKQPYHTRSPNPCVGKYSMKKFFTDKYHRNQKIVIYDQDKIIYKFDSESSCNEILHKMLRYFIERYDDWIQYLETGIYPEGTNDFVYCEMWAYKEILRIAKYVA